MNTEEILKKIKKWSGCNKEYWQAVNLLNEHNRISDVIYNRLKKGLDCYTESIVNAGMREFKTELETKVKTKKIKPEIGKLEEYKESLKESEGE